MRHIYMAVDLGSTMIDSCLIDAEDKDVLAQRSTKNPQRLYGSDVINRILTVKRDISFLVKMRDQTVAAIVELLQEMLEDTKKQVEHTEREHELVKLDAVAITGNTTMISILLGYDISDMGEAPFPTTLHGSVIVPGQELFTKEEYQAARATVTDAFYTDQGIAKSMWETLRRFGFQQGNLLEPSLGIGNFFSVMDADPMIHRYGRDRSCECAYRKTTLPKG